jgi:cell division transport system permease protein
MIAFARRTQAFQESLRLLGHRLGVLPGALAAVSMTSAILALIGLFWWHVRPLSSPDWMRAQAVVMVAGAEGDVDLSTLGRNLAEKEGVVRVDFISREAALHDLTMRPGLAGAALGDLHPNPLPDAFRIVFDAGMPLDRVNVALGHIGKMNHVANWIFDQDLYERTLAFRRLLQSAAGLAVLIVAGWVLSIWLGLRTVLAVNLDAARIANLVGAPAVQIRRPHVYAGALFGALAALASVALVQAVSALILSDLVYLITQMGLTWQRWVAPPWVMAAAVAMGVTMGAAIQSVRWRFLARRQYRAAV